MQIMDKQEVEMVSGGVILAAVGLFIVVTITTDRMGLTDIWPDETA